MSGSRRGLAAMDPEKRRLIQSMGGKAVPAEARAFSDRTLAAAAGKMGGLRRRKRAAKAVVTPEEDL